MARIPKKTVSFVKQTAARLSKRAKPGARNKAVSLYYSGLYTYGYSNAIKEGIFFRWPHQLKKKAECFEFAVTHYLIAEQMGLDPRFFIANGIKYNNTTSGDGYDHAFIDVDIGGKNRCLVDPLFSMFGPYTIKENQIELVKDNVHHHKGSLPYKELFCFDKKGMLAEIRQIQEKGGGAIMFRTGQTLPSHNSSKYLLNRIFWYDNNNNRLNLILREHNAFFEGKEIVNKIELDSNAKPRTSTLFFNTFTDSSWLHTSNNRNYGSIDTKFVEELYRGLGISRIQVNTKKFSLDSILEEIYLGDGNYKESLVSHKLQDIVSNNFKQYIAAEDPDLRDRAATALALKSLYLQKLKSKEQKNKQNEENQKQAFLYSKSKRKQVFLQSGENWTQAELTSEALYLSERLRDIGAIKKGRSLNEFRQQREKSRPCMLEFYLIDALAQKEPDQAQKCLDYLLFIQDALGESRKNKKLNKEYIELKERISSYQNSTEQDSELGKLLRSAYWDSFKRFLSMSLYALPELKMHGYFTSTRNEIRDYLHKDNHKNNGLKTRRKHPNKKNKRKNQARYITRWLPKATREWVFRKSEVLCESTQGKKMRLYSLMSSIRKENSFYSIADNDFPQMIRMPDQILRYKNSLEHMVERFITARAIGLQPEIVLYNQGALHTPEQKKGRQKKTKKRTSIGRLDHTIFLDHNICNMLSHYDKIFFAELSANNTLKLRQLDNFSEKGPDLKFEEHLKVRTLSELKEFINFYNSPAGFALFIAEPKVMKGRSADKLQSLIFWPSKRTLEVSLFESGNEVLMDTNIKHSIKLYKNRNTKRKPKEYLSFGFNSQYSPLLRRPREYWTEPMGFDALEKVLTHLDKAGLAYKALKKEHASGKDKAAVFLNILEMLYAKSYSNLTEKDFQWALDNIKHSQTKGVQVSETRKEDAQVVAQVMLRRLNALSKTLHKEIDTSYQKTIKKFSKRMKSKKKTELLQDTLTIFKAQIAGRALYYSDLEQAVEQQKDHVGYIFPKEQFLSIMTQEAEAHLEYCRDEALLIYERIANEHFGEKAKEKKIRKKIKQLEKEKKQKGHYALKRRLTKFSINKKQQLRCLDMDHYCMKNFGMQPSYVLHTMLEKEGETKGRQKIIEQYTNSMDCMMQELDKRGLTLKDAYWTLAKYALNDSLRFKGMLLINKSKQKIINALEKALENNILEEGASCEQEVEMLGPPINQRFRKEMLDFFRQTYAHYK